ncbi:hypothetical protein [Xylanimonas cellulosilytica]|nr:hypothetical protein [Xylanimonas cellulosilytica]
MTRSTMRPTARLSARPAARLAAAAATATCLVAVAACSGPSDAGTSASDDATVGPLEAMITEIVGDWNSAEQQAKQMEMEEAVARCMADEGFEYTPVDYSALMAEVDAVDTTTREYAQEYGYGHSIQPDTTGNPMPEFVDPNEDYVAAMSESESEAYYEALYGAMEYDVDNVDSIPDMSEMGCTGAAQVEIMGQQDTSLFDNEELTAFGENMEQLEADVAADPKVAEAAAGWAECMADAGFDYATPQEAQDDFMTRSQAIWEEADPESVDAPEQDADLQEQEREAAVADFDCKEKVGYDAIRREVQFALEQEYIDTHEAELEAVKAAFESLGL